MAIKTGYRMYAEKSYTQTFVMSESEAESRYNSDPSTWEGYTLTPVRVVKNKWMWYFVEEDNVLRTIRRLFSGDVRISIYDNPYLGVEDKFRTWESNIEAGKNYLCSSEMSTKEFLSKYTTQSSDWQVLAHEWAVANPSKMFILEVQTPATRSRTYVWRVMARGEYVEFSLPHHDCGGEKDYISRFDKPTRKVLVNVD